MPREQSEVDKQYDLFLKNHKCGSVFESMAAHELERMIYDCYGDPAELALWDASNAPYKERYTQEHNENQ